MPLLLFPLTSKLEKIPETELKCNVMNVTICASHESLRQSALIERNNFGSALPCPASDSGLCPLAVDTSMDRASMSKMAL